MLEKWEVKQGGGGDEDDRLSLVVDAEPPQGSVSGVPTFIKKDFSANCWDLWDPYALQ